MSNDEQLKMYQDLIFANELMKSNIEEFKKLNDLNLLFENIQKMQNLDEKLIIDKFDKLDFENVSKSIFKKLELSENKFDELNSKLLVRIDRFENAVDGLMQIDAIAENTSLIIDNNEKIKNKIKFMPSLIIAISVGFFTFFASNFNHFFSEKIQNESIFIDIVESPYFMIDPEDRNTIYLNLKNDVKASFLQDMTNKDRYLIKFEK